MGDAAIVDSSTTDGFKMRTLRPRPLSRYDSTYALLGNYDIEKALQILDAEDWMNAESFLNPWGSQRVTLVHFAACRGNLRILERTAALNANLYATDEYGRCALHYAAGQGHVEVVKWLLEHSVVDEKQSGKGTRKSETSPHPQLSLRDHHGRTALHEAVKAKHVEVVTILVNAGAHVNAKDEQGVPPFLLAHSNVGRNDSAMIRRYEQIVDILASAWASVTIIHPLTGWTALHYAVTLNSCRATHRLIKCGANPNYLRSGRIATTPVHLAATFGYHQTLRILLKNLPSSLVDTMNTNGRSSLHLAAMLGNLECVRSLIDYGGNLAKETSAGDTVIDLLSMFKHDEDLAGFFTDILDTKVQLVDKVQAQAQIVYEIELDFQMLTPEGQPQMAVISAMMKALSRKEQITILQHPVMEIYLGQKWSRVRYVFYSVVVIHIVFVLILSCYGMVLLRKDIDSTLLRRLLLFSTCIMFGQNFLQLFTKPKCYCHKFENWLSLSCVTLSFVVAVAGELTPNSMTSYTSKDHDALHQPWQPSWVLHVISIASLLAWMQIMLLAGRFPSWGFYALIFSTVLKNVLKVFFIGIWIIISFTLSFTLLFHGENHFDMPLNAFVKTVVMMTGEYDYADLFPTGKNDSTANSENQNTFLSINSRIIFLIFVILASIVLMNLMIGLAVNDIKGLVKEGQFSRLLKQAEFIADCEWMTKSGMCHLCLVPAFLTKILKSTIDKKKTLLWHWAQKQQQDISKKLWTRLFKLGVKNRDLAKKCLLTSPRSKNIDSDMSEVAIRQRCATLDDELENINIYINCGYAAKDEPVNI